MITALVHEYLNTSCTLALQWQNGGSVLGHYSRLVASNGINTKVDATYLLKSFGKRALCCYALVCAIA